MVRSNGGMLLYRCVHKSDQHRCKLFDMVMDCGLRTVPNTRAPRSANNCAISLPMPQETPVTNVILPFSEMCIYTLLLLVIAF